jgi:hypothetical protein
MLATTVAHAQSSADGGYQTLGGGNTKIGGYGGPSAKFGTVDGKFAMFFGGYGGVYLAQSVLLGGGGYSLVSDVKANSETLPNPLQQDLSLSMGYGGPMVEVTFMSNDAIHFGLNTMVGFGSASVSATSGSGGELSTGRLVLLEPTLFAEVNVTNWFRVAVGGGYRLVTSSRLQGYNANQLSGANLDISLKFGKFW